MIGVARETATPRFDRGLRIANGINPHALRGFAPYDMKKHAECRANLAADATQARAMHRATQESEMSSTKSPLSRRQVVAGAGTAGAVAAVASLLPMGSEPVKTAEAEGAKTAEARPGYRLTAHVERYYQTAKV